MSGAGLEADASVCYRHPDRTSWTLCERCGRTICPECQILTPQGVRCPTCIEELGGSVQWAPAAGPRPEPKKQKRVRARSTTALDDRPGWQRALIEMVRPGGSTPLISWALVGVSLVTWLVGIFTVLPFTWLAVGTGAGWQAWRYATYPITSVPIYSALNVISFLLNIVFFLLSAPGAERQYGRARFAAIVVSAGLAGGAISGLIGGVAFGLFGILFGIFGSFLISVWPSPQARTRLLIMIGVYVLITLVLSAALIGEVIGGLIGGTGAGYLVQRFADSEAGTKRARRIIVGSLAGLVVLAVVVSVLRSLG
jgi:membrane associated rhomboid family serine protease